MWWWFIWNALWKCSFFKPFHVEESLLKPSLIYLTPIKRSPSWSDNLFYLWLFLRVSLISMESRFLLPLKFSVLTSLYLPTTKHANPGSQQFIKLYLLLLLSLQFNLECVFSVFRSTNQHKLLCCILIDHIDWPRSLLLFATVLQKLLLIFFDQ